MKKYSKPAFLIAIAFAAGTLSGAFIRLGVEVAQARPESVGGEAFILPLIILLFLFGYIAGRGVTNFWEKSAPIELYIKGVRDGSRIGAGVKQVFIKSQCAVCVLRRRYSKK